MELDFENKVKRSFSRVKKHMERIEEKIKQNKAILEHLIRRVGKSTPEDKIESRPLKEPLNENDLKSSTGSEGVCASMQASKHASKQHLNNQFEDSDEISPHFDQNFPPKTNEPTLFEVLSTLTNREFLIFLTIYQLGEASYKDVASKLSLTNGCIRSHVCSLIAKKAPITRRKINNWKVSLSIDASFKSLTSEDKLLEMYYQRDPSQTTIH